MHDDLGPVSATHETKVHNLIALPLLPGVFGALGLLGALANLGKSNESSNNDASPAGMALMVLGSAALVALSIWLARWRIRRSKRTYAIHDGGLVIHDATGARAYGWHQIAARIRRLKHAAPEIDLTLTDRKLSIKGEHVKDVLGLFERIDQGITRAQYAPLLQQLEQGRSIVVGNIQLDASGVTHGNKRIEWNEAEVTEFSIDGYFIKNREHGFLKGMIKSIFVHWEPNMRLVHLLASTFAQRATSR